MGKLDGKVAVITGGTTGMALAGAKLFVDEGAHVFITGRRQDALEAAVKQIGRNVTGVQGDADDLDRLYDTVKREKGSLDVLWASAGVGEPAKRQFKSLIPAARWAAPTKSPPPPSSSPPTTPATSTAWNSSPTAAPPPSKPDKARPGQDIS
jgi:NAD(P)-dependent dehydrogenase (short-subunit alcohol dehydrogenase family)